MEVESADGKEVPEIPDKPEENPNPSVEAPEGNKTPEEVHADQSNSDETKDNTTDIQTDDSDKTEQTPSSEEKDDTEEPTDNTNAKISERKTSQDEKNPSSTEIAEVSMDDFSSDATPLDEGADPMPEGEEATCKEDIPQDNDVQPDVAGTEVETIQPSKENESSPPEDTKYVITHHHSHDDERCCMCEQDSAPKYIAKKNDESLYICVNDCLTAFKEKHQNNYIEKILRLRSFATQEKLVPETREEEFECENDDEKVSGTRKCGYCKSSISPEMHIAWESMDFCNEGCLLNYQRTINSNCGKCQTAIFESVIGKYCVRFGAVITQFCSTACIISYKKSNSFFCAFCQQEMKNRSEYKSFCSKRCLETCQPQTSAKEKVPCAVCHDTKPVEIRVRMASKMESVCGERCFMAYKFVNKIQPVKCEACITHFQLQGSSDPVVYLNNKQHVVCSKECQKIFLLMNRKIISCNTCSIKKYDFDMVKVYDMGQEIKYTCSNACMKVNLDKKFQEIEDAADINIKQLENCIKDTDLKVNGKNLQELLKTNGVGAKTPVHKIILTKPRPFVKQRNISTMCKPKLFHKSVFCKPEYATVEVQTEDRVSRVFVPVPMPIHVPTPLHMFAMSVPFLVPIPLPLPVPIFIPTGRKSIAGIAKEIQKIKNRVPADPLEAELLMMAEMAAGDKKDESSSESEAEEVSKEEPFTEETTEATPGESFGEDVLTMALTMASNFEEPAETDAPSAPSASTEPDPTSRIESIMEAKRKNIRQATKTKPRRSDPTPTPPPPPPQPQITPDARNPDSDLCLKYTFGVNAWKQWVTIKNAELQKTQKRPKLFKTDLLQLTADDLNFSLCLFVREVRKPSGAEYAPDTIYYLCLGIQQYLYENTRIDNIFCDSFYEKFTDTFNEVCQKFANLYSDSQYIVTRVEEEHLWESKQLGAHSPLVLLNTLMFFNTKHFSLTTVDEHLQLSFSHIMKHWKRNSSAPGSRSVLLRFYPPMSAEGRKKKVYEQQENDDNPLRCPVKLYEFYLSKCPESVKTRNDVFYLLPERSCVPDSPVWYSTMALDKEPLVKMLNRIKMVKEINVALLTT